MRIRDLAASLSHKTLSILRITTGIVLLQHPIQKFFMFPVERPGPAMFSQSWFAGVIELVLAPLLIIGLFTRPVAFVLCGLMAFAYFLGHALRGFFPSANGGNLAIMYCFVCLYLAAAGGGPWSADAALEKRGSRLPV